jgi:hypothetical protein
LNIIPNSLRNIYQRFMVIGGMGWTSNYNWTTKQDVVSEILRDCSFSGATGESRVIKHSLVGNHLWIAYESCKAGGDPRRAVLLCLIEKVRADGCYAYKPMDESMEPYYYDCPQSIIDAAGPTGDVHAQAWRAKVADARREKAGRKSLVASLKVGDVVSIAQSSGKYQVISLGPKPTCRRVDVLDGRTYRLPVRRVEAVEDFSTEAL